MVLALYVHTSPIVLILTEQCQCDPCVWQPGHARTPVSAHHIGQNLCGEEQYVDNETVCASCETDRLHGYPPACF